MTAVGTPLSVGPQSQSGSRLAPGFQLGDYRLGQPLWPLRIADAYRAEGPKGAATIYVVHARIAEDATVRDQVIAGTRIAAALPEHKHLARTLAAGLTGNILWIATEEVEGSLVRDLLAKKRASGGGLGTRATGNLIAGVAAALSEATHGVLDGESVAVSRTGRVRVIDLALAQGTLAAMVAGLIPTQSSVAPELFTGGAPNGSADVYAIGALLYESLVGSPLERGGPRPSDVVNGLSTQIDEIVARSCHRDPTKRFGRADVLGEVVTEALQQGGAVQTAAVPLIDQAPSLEQVSLASSIASAEEPASSNHDLRRGDLDRALAAAVADTTEKWLVSKGKLDYGPFSLADILAQIEKCDIVSGNIIVDKDSGARVDVGEHPLLGPMVEAAMQRRDDARRAQAEVAVQRRDKKRGVMLYGMITLGVAAVGLGVYFLIAILGKGQEDKVEAVEAVAGSKLDVKISEPKKPPPARRPGGRRTSNGGAYRQGNENLALDLSGDDDDEGSETLPMGKIFATYSRYGGQLGGCLASTGEHSANIYINIDGKSGRVSFVRINGKTGGPLFNCLGRVLRGMQFPRINGPRTRAEFDISM